MVVFPLASSIADSNLSFYIFVDEVSLSIFQANSLRMLVPLTIAIQPYHLQLYITRSIQMIGMFSNLNISSIDAVRMPFGVCQKRKSLTAKISLSCSSCKMTKRSNLYFLDIQQTAARCQQLFQVLMTAPFASYKDYGYRLFQTWEFKLNLSNAMGLAVRTLEC